MKKTQAIPKFDRTVDIVKVDQKERIVGGVVYAPNMIDAQGDWTDEAEICKAMYNFMEEVQSFDLMHEGSERNVVILECFQPEIQTLKGGKTIPAGCMWVTVRINDEEMWKRIDGGEITGFSIEGSATGMMD